MAGHWLWARYGAGAFDKMQHHMARALVLVTTTEIATAAMLAVELLTRARHPLRLLLYCNYLRMRFRCQDDTVLRLKFTQGNTAFYHAQVGRLTSLSCSTHPGRVLRVWNWLVAVHGIHFAVTFCAQVPGG